MCFQSILIDVIVLLCLPKAQIYMYTWTYYYYFENIVNKVKLKTGAYRKKCFLSSETDRPICRQKGTETMRENIDGTDGWNSAASMNSLRWTTKSTQSAERWKNWKKDMGRNRNQTKEEGLDNPFEREQKTKRNAFVQNTTAILEQLGYCEIYMKLNVIICKSHKLYFIYQMLKLRNVRL